MGQNGAGAPVGIQVQVHVYLSPVRPSGGLVRLLPVRLRAI